MKRHLIASLIVLAGLVLPAAVPARADVANDIAFTAFSNVDVNALAGGKVLQARGGLIDFQRGITAQSLYLIDAAPETVRAKLVNWNPAAHPELKVWVHLALPARPTAADFGGLSQLPDNSSVKFLVDATAKLDPANPSLQVTRAEAQQIASIAAAGGDPRTIFANAWSQVLAGRISHFLGAQLGSENYAVSGGDVQPLAEIKSLLRSDVKVYARYHSLLAGTPIYAKSTIVPTGLYYESFDVEGGAALGTGAIYQSRTASTNRPDPAAAAALNTDYPAPVPVSRSSGPILSADIEYFVNYGIYVSVELEQMSPVNVNGKTETLVWRNDMVSTQNVAYLHGTERLASGMIMLQDVQQAIEAFRSEFK
jgi:hypothetical protein